MLKKITQSFTANPLNVSYTLDIDKTILATFSTLSGGNIDLDVIKHNVVYPSGEYRTLMIPAATRFSPVVLSNGYGNTRELYNWFVAASNGVIRDARKNVTINLNASQSGKYNVLVAWNLTNAYPVSISGFEANQESGASVAKFSITLVTESIERVDPDK